MSYHLAFANRTVGVYTSSNPTALQISQVKDFLEYLKQFCQYTLTNDLDNVRSFNRQNTILLFLLSSLEDFQRLKKLGCFDASVNIVAYYLCTKEFEQVNNKSFRAPLKALSFHLVYPNENTPEGLLYANKKKILDKIYEKTLKTKYESIKIRDYFSTFDLSHKFAEIQEISRYFKDMGLNSDDTTAGAIALRFRNGILTNASKTDKTNIPEDRICYVENYNRKGNQIYWVGLHPPSSESAVSFLAFQKFTNANILLHFHYKPITYSSKLAIYRTQEYVEYGTYEEAETLVNKLRETEGFAIAHGHGEFIIASDLAEARAKISDIISLL